MGTVLLTKPILAFNALRVVKGRPENAYLESVDGEKRLAAVEALAMLLSHFRSSLTGCLKNSALRNISMTDVKWVVTLPSRFGSEGHGLVKDAAKKAGICAEAGGNVAVISEMDAIAHHYLAPRCKDSQTDSPTDNPTISDLDNSLVVVEIGGQCTRISLCKGHERLMDRNKSFDFTLEVGGLYLRNRIERLMALAVGGCDVIKKLKENCWLLWTNCLCEVERQYCRAAGNEASQKALLTIQLSYALSENIKSVMKQCGIERTKSDSGVCYSGACIKIRTTKIEQILKEMVDVIVDTLRPIVKANNSLDNTELGLINDGSSILVGEPYGQNHSGEGDNEIKVCPKRHHLYTGSIEETSMPPVEYPVDRQAEVTSPSDIPVYVTGGLVQLPYIKKELKQHLQNVQFSEDPWSDVMKGALEFARLQKCLAEEG